MATQFKYLEQVLRTLAALPAPAGTFDPTPLIVDVSWAVYGIVCVNFVQDVGAATAYPQLQARAHRASVDDAIPLTLRDLANTATQGTQIVGPLAGYIDRMEALAGGYWRYYGVDLRAVPRMSLVMAEVNQGATPSTAQAILIPEPRSGS